MVARSIAKYVLVSNLFVALNLMLGLCQQVNEVFANNQDDQDLDELRMGTELLESRTLSLLSLLSSLRNKYLEEIQDAIKSDKA